MAAGETRPHGGSRVDCVSCLVIDDDHNVLWERNPHARLANASTTKMVTALVVVGRADPRTRFTVSPRAAATGGGGPQLAPGAHVTVGRLLEALLVASSNDAAAVLAEGVGGNQASFVASMNRLVRRLGAEDTHFVNPHGLDAPGHFSSAADLALFAEELLRHPLLARIVRERSVRIRTTTGPERFENTNLLLETYPGMVGVKTGYTIAAGNVLVTAARRAGRRLISVAMHSTDAFQDSRRLLDLGWARLGHTVLLARGTDVGSLVFDPAGATEVTAGKTVRGIEDPNSVTIGFEAAPPPGDSIAAGDRVGSITLNSGGVEFARVPAVATRSLGAGDSAIAGILARILDLGSRLIPVGSG
ncbi:MAG: hypothetical protein QOH90_1612 [Actinomycetota bacterium]|jgi:D-alanyl-D-alanine carboxypeptidase|nr:hypothetical protein [Actinomycetota bacterium]